MLTVFDRIILHLDCLDNYYQPKRPEAKIKALETALDSAWAQLDLCEAGTKTPEDRMAGESRARDLLRKRAALVVKELAECPGTESAAYRNVKALSELL